MKVLLSSPLLFAYSLEDVFQTAYELGYDGVEVWHIHFLKSGETPENLRDLAMRLGLLISVHALSWDLNFTSKLKKIREASLEMLEESILFAERLNANPVVFHPGRKTIPEDNEEDYWEMLIDGVNRLCYFSHSRDIELALEIMEHIPKEFFINPEDSTRIVNEVSLPNFGITFDAAHVPLNFDPLVFLKKVSGVKHIHFSDLTPDRRHIALGTGVRDFYPLLKYVKDEVNVDIAIEGLETKRDLRLARHNKKQIDHLLRSINQTSTDFEQLIGGG